MKCNCMKTHLLMDCHPGGGWIHHFLDLFPFFPQRLLYVLCVFPPITDHFSWRFLQEEYRMCGLGALSLTFSIKFMLPLSEVPFFKKISYYFIVLYVGVLLAYMSMYTCVCLIPAEPRIRYWVSWNWSYRRLFLWALEIGLQSSGREASALNYGTIFLALFWILLF